MSKYLLDTNIISFYLKGDESLKEKVLSNIDSIAGIAKSNNLVMVTDNAQHFERIENLKVENWKGWGKIFFKCELNYRAIL